jgi:hypothetical protein
MARTQKSPAPIEWLTSTDAAEFLKTTPSALRKKFERAIKKTGGGMEAHIDGVRARKFGGRWLVSVGPEWTK